MTAKRSTRLCVLIDAENVSPGHADAIFSEIAGLGQTSVRRIFGDWSDRRLDLWAEQVAPRGLIVDQQFSKAKGKNASDIALVIAAMEYLQSGRFDGFVLVSSDSDFTPLAHRISEYGLDVFGIGEQKSPEAFRMACRRFICIDEPATPQAAAPALPDPPTKAVPLIRKAMQLIDPGGEWYAMSEIGSAIRKAKPDFDSRLYGSGKLSVLLGKLQEFELRTQGKTLQVRRKP